ncbi:hypothetical protein B1R47_25170 [Salmonella enterica subsp. enterica serovar Weltevreden]|uniref:Uncharacterized protein n=3 Tax=Salmonella enterica TaxID=28901 RepID=A0A5Y6M4B5_SALHO|nr:hypothetical protein [Salmonella enterica]EAA7382828.1 hypothetical protein [Salmonella enterica subsp. enterica]EBF8286488.1 hypothetical protein [Salmonella enterica subsp. houtenae]ECE0559525.1 hypothetical protein [Salmonella enterica subsp. enterica serovar Richmond]ECU3287366.1 hypothetical protein [Salmonella enterica subsp. houtenae serovar Houten]EDS4967208.1 hypothetical protein [Salmonella enterica subsp. enterica serovar O rough]EGZ4105167.1 hypothetical protein [Salmonella ent
MNIIHTPYSLKTRTDAFIWLSHLEGDLLSIRASLNAGLYPPYDKSEEPEFECAVYNSGMACGEFLERLCGGDINPLSTTGIELLSTLEHMGKTLCEPVWTQAVKCGRHEVIADRAICAADADGWIM